MPNEWYILGRTNLDFSCYMYAYPPVPFIGHHFKSRKIHIPSIKIKIRCVPVFYSTYMNHLLLSHVSFAAVISSFWNSNPLCILYCGKYLYKWQQQSEQHSIAARLESLVIVDISNLVVNTKKQPLVTCTLGQISCCCMYVVTGQQQQQSVHASVFPAVVPRQVDTVQFFSGSATSTKLQFSAAQGARVSARSFWQVHGTPQLCFL